MNRQVTLANLFTEIARKGQRNLVVFTAQVVSVQGKTCTVNIDGIDVSDVRLNPTTSEYQDEFLLTPSIGSFVLVGSLSGNLDNLCVVSYDTIDSVKITIDDTSLFIDKNGVFLNGGELGGLVKLHELTDKINVLERQLNELKNIFKGWMPTANDGGAALKSGVGVWAVQTIDLTKSEDLENEKVKQ